jgi:hypothetical protein
VYGFRQFCLNASTLVPLSDDGVIVNRAVCTHVARFNFDFKARPGWLKGISAGVRNVVDVHDAAELEKCCLEWERRCSPVAEECPAHR